MNQMMMIIITVDAVDVADAVDAVDADEIDKLCKRFAHCTVQGKNQLYCIEKIPDFPIQ